MCRVSLTLSLTLTLTKCAVCVSQALRDAIEARPATPPLVLLQQRCWLMHWALFIFGDHTSF